MAGTQEKTEQPTGKKIREARNRGQVARSKELTSVGVLLAGAAAAWLSADLVRSGFRQLIEELWAKDAFLMVGESGIEAVASKVILAFFVMTAPVMAAGLVAAAAFSMMQTKGFFFSFEALRISLTNLNPISGFRKFFSLRSLTELVKSILKIVIIGYAAASVLIAARGQLLGLAGMDTASVLGLSGGLAVQIVVRAGGAMLLLSLLDLFYQRWQHRKDLMMTRQEIKEEHKQSEGNPQIKAKIRAIQRFIAKQRMLANVPKASVVITNPTHYAVALKYTQGMDAPVLVARGVDFLALKIARTARKHGIPVVQSPPLARALYKQVKLDEIIPVALYRAVAKILAYIYQQRQGLRKS